MALFSISEIFDKRLFRVPDFQRGYSWTERQLNDFWEDVHKLRDDKIHYTGLLTLEKVNIDNSNFDKWSDLNWLIKELDFIPFYIVDGQQRLTTIIVLINSMLELISETDMLLHNNKQQYVEKYIYRKNESILSYIFGYEKDDPSYECLKTKIYKHNSSNSLNQPETIYTQNLLNAQKFFLEKLEDLNINAIEKLFRKVTLKLKFNLYEVDDDLDVYVTFETMNNRGKPLTKLELLKNRLIYLSTVLENNEEEKFNLRNQINAAWKTIYEYLGKNNDEILDDDDFLKNHTYMYFRYMDKEGDLFVEHLMDKIFTVSKVLEKEIRLNDIENYVDSIRRSVIKWFEIKFPQHPSSTIEDNQLKEWIAKVNRLSFPPFLPNIMACLLINTPNDKMLKLLKSMERYVFLVFRITQRRSHTGKNYFFARANEVYQRTLPVSDLIMLIDEKTKDPQTGFDISLFRAYLRTVFDNVTNKIGFSGWNGIEFFLYEYELALKNQEEPKVSWYFLKKINSIEHIYPQTPQHDCWINSFGSFLPDQKVKLCHSLGNLVLISRKKNSTLLNKCFDYKKRHQSSDNEFEGYFNGSHSEIEVSNSYQNWTALEILDRSIKMLNFMEKRWDIRIGGFDDKKKMLFLEFLSISEQDLSQIRTN